MKIREFYANEATIQGFANSGITLKTRQLIINILQGRKRENVKLLLLISCHLYPNFDKHTPLIINQKTIIIMKRFFIFAANGMLTILTTVFLANTVDYGELKNNRRDESVIFSMQTFVVKLASGVAALIASICLSVFHLSDDTSNTAAVADAVSNSSVIGLRMTMTVLPIVGLLIAVFYFRKKYMLNEEKVDEIAAQIKEKRRAEQR